MDAVRYENQLKLLFYAILASVVIHAGVFALLVRLNQRFTWIPVDQSFVEVSIVTQMPTLMGDTGQYINPGPKTQPSQKRSAPKKINSYKPSQQGPALKTAEPDLRQPDINPSPGDKSPADIEMAMVSDSPLPSSDGPVAGTGGFGSQGGGGNNSAAAGSAGQGNFGSRMNYLDMVRYKIEHQKKYPNAAQQRNIEGQVTVEFEINLDGQISEPMVSKSSGNDTLDLAAINAVKKASPFDSPPKQLFNDGVHINLPIKFELIR